MCPTCPASRKSCGSATTRLPSSPISWWRAKKALESLPTVWDNGANAKVSSATIADFLKEGLDAEQAFVGNQAGDVKSALAGAAKVVEATYSYPYQNHAPMEPMNATALYTADRCEVWCSTQNGESALAVTAEAAGLPVAQCDVHKTFLGGGFGRRGQSDYVRQAVTIAKELPGTPVKLLWSREEDMTHCYYHPITQCKMTAGFDANKNLIAFHMRISGQSILATVLPSRMENGKDPVIFQGLSPGGPEGAFGYNIPNILIDHAMRNPSVPAGFWRGVNTNHNAIYVETFMDQLAHEIGEDPLAFRLKYLKPKHAAVLKAVADKAGYGQPAPQGVYRGLSQIMGFGSYVAACAEVSVTNGHVQDPPHRRRHQFGPRRQSGADRAAGRGLVRLWAFGHAVWRMHRARRPHRAEELRYVSGDADRRDAEGRGRRHAGRRVLGRRRRADDRGCGACRAQRHLRGDRQAHPQLPAQEQ